MIAESRISSPVYLDAQADARWYPTDALQVSVETFASISNDPSADMFEVFNASERLAAFNKEIARRERVARLSDGAATVRDLSHEAWTALARHIKETVAVPEILRLAGLPMRRTGTSRGRDEWHGPCPVCGTGDDRLCCWGGPNGRLWCRQCHWSGDALSAGSLLVTTGNFRDIVRFLASYAGLETPSRQPSVSTDQPGHFEYRRGKLVLR